MRRQFTRFAAAVLLLASAALLSAAAPDPASSAPTADAVQPAPGVRLIPIARGTAKNTVNVAVFRKQSVVTHGDTQFAAFYDADGKVVLAKRTLPSDAWEIKTTALTGTTKDAHNAVNIGVDGDGVLHVAWDHHNNPLNYRRGKARLSLDLVEAKMTGQDEKSVTYPEFHPLPNGDLLFLYRDGGSGRGNLAMNRYDVKTRTWTHLFSKLVDGEGQRNAYWQACTDAAGTIHLSWVWRESPDVASNHDLAYARSTDGGKTWTRSTGEAYALPITAATAEYALKIPPKHELMNQTSMTADANGRPYIATYYRPEGTDVPQYFVVYHDGAAWRATQAGELKTPFRLGGGGTKRVPISRPQILADDRGGKLTAYLVFRADERGGRATLATCDDLAGGHWAVRDLTTSTLGQWEPTYDPTLWQRDRVLDLFVQRAEQVDAEGVGALPPQMVYVAEVRP
jgi:hypothetical protein